MAVNGKKGNSPKPLFTEQELKIIDPILKQKPPIIEIPISVLKVDDSYQDRPRDRIVKQIMYHFSEALLNILFVSRRSDGSLWVMDGVSRCEGLQQRGLPDYPVRCQVFDNPIGRPAEALFFAFTNSTRSKDPIKIENVYQAQYIAGTDGGFGKAVEDCGFMFLRGRRQLHGPKYCKQAWELDDGTAMKKALYTIKDCWRDQYPVYGYMVKGVALLYHRYNRKSLDEPVRRILKRFSPKQIMDKVNERFAKYGGGRLHPDDKPDLVCRVIAGLINLHPGKMGKLDLSKLDDRRPEA